MMRGREDERRNEREWLGEKLDGWMDVFGRSASPRKGGPLGKASGGKINRWFVNLLLGTAYEKKKKGEKVLNKQQSSSPSKQHLFSLPVPLAFY